MRSSHAHRTASTPRQIERAPQLLAGAENAEVESLKKLHPFDYFSYARLFAKAKLEKSSAFGAARFAKVGPAALQLQDFLKSSAHLQIEKA